jgi:hypothetical protein
MRRVSLIHWNPAGAQERAGVLRSAGHRVRLVEPRTAKDFAAAADCPPDVFVIDLDRLPSHGREAGLFLRRRKASRAVPIVFAGGPAEKVARVQRVLPDAVFATWRGVRGAVRRALASPPRDPVAPGPMAAYSGVSLSKKLGIAADRRVALLGAPAGFEVKLDPLPCGVRVRRRAVGLHDLVVLFAKSKAVLARRFAAAVSSTDEKGRLWIAWRKQGSGARSDLTQSEVRRYGMARGLVDYKICAIDETWSGLCFARRRKK